MDKPFLVNQKAWFINYPRPLKGEKRKAQKIECIIIDGYYQPNTRQRREGWKVMIMYIDEDGVKLYRERYLDRLNVK